MSRAPLATRLSRRLTGRSDTPATTRPAYDETSSEYERDVGAAWARRETAVRSWWQSPVIVGEVQRRITGDPCCGWRSTSAIVIARSPWDAACRSALTGG